METFAYGKDTVGSCECPAVQAGYSPGNGDDSSEVAAWYDETVEMLGYSNARSIITEEKAKKAWLEAIEAVEEDASTSNEHAEVAREIAEVLGWL